MAKNIIFAALLLAGLTFAGTSAGRTFEFASGGAYHFEGFGEWTVRLDEGGNFSVRHNVLYEEMTEYGPYRLTPAETKHVWELIDDAELSQVDFPPRAGAPDEVYFTFEVEGGAGGFHLPIWINDVRKDKGIKALVKYLSGLIKKYAGVKPVLW